MELNLEEKHSIKDWDLLPKNTQKAFLRIIESIILGENIAILDNDPVSGNTRQIALSFRLSPKIISGSLPNYIHNVDLKENVKDNGITLNPNNGKIHGENKKNDFLEKYMKKQVLKLPSITMQARKINLLLDTIGTTINIILSLESQFSHEQGQITNLLNNIGFEEVRIVLEIIKKNNYHYHEKLLELPIHQEWFSQW
jgi:hypothetical protein